MTPEEQKQWERDLLAGTLFEYTYEPHPVRQKAQHRCLRCHDGIPTNQVLCDACEIAVLMQAAPPHGKRGTYQSRGCRCAYCTLANSVYIREWHRKKRAS